MVGKDYGKQRIISVQINGKEHCGFYIVDRDLITVYNKLGEKTERLGGHVVLPEEFAKRLLVEIVTETNQS